jgi:hypothetical protein
MNIANKEWRKLMKTLGNPLFVNSPQGKTVFASGAAAVLTAFKDDRSSDQWHRVRKDFTAFVEAYMAESKRLTDSKEHKEFKQRMAEMDRRVNERLSHAKPLGEGATGDEVEGAGGGVDLVIVRKFREAFEH